MNTKLENPSNIYVRSLKVLILLSVLGEAVIFLVWGVFLYPEGSILHKFLWTIVYCGLGMGSAAGAFVVFLVVNKMTGWKAILTTSLISGILLGLFCNYLCFNLDMHFNHFGGADTPGLFIWNGIIMSFLGGAFGGWLLFTDKGNHWLDRIRL
ncbi:MAG: hypothetical protein R3B93_06205 [Bacteroidia bacterium]